MKRIKLLLLAAVSTVSGFAQLSGDGYYRVQNQRTERYITIVDDRGSVNVETTDADLAALKTVMGFERVVSDPASVIYIKKMTTGYDIQSQGTGSYNIVGYEMRITDLRNGTYAAYATAKGLTKYLSDAIPNWMMDEEEKIYGSVVTNSQESRYWYIKPVKNADDYYFDIAPDISVGGSYYKSFYAAFGFSFASQGMTAYYVSAVDKARGCVVIKPITGNVAPATPVIVKCSSAQPASNKLNLLNSTGKGPTDNKLSGVYFCNPDAGKNHTNVVNYLSNAMRVLGKDADGSLAFVKPTDLKYIPANTAYLAVTADAPATLKVLTETEYNQMLAEQVTITAKSYSRTYGDPNPTFEYDLSGAELKGGVPALSCNASATSPVGKYTIKVAKGGVTNGFATLVDGVLTITPAELTVTANDATRNVGEDNPAFQLTYAGFKNGETESVLSVKPTAITAATKDSPAGVYDITVVGGSASNYTFKYVSGKLTVNVSAAVSGATKATDPFDVYDIYGKKVLQSTTTLDGLRKGIYVVKGRKLIVN